MARFYNRLRTNRKPFKVAITAVMRNSRQHTHHGEPKMDPKLHLKPGTDAALQAHVMDVHSGWCKKPAYYALM